MEQVLYLVMRKDLPDNNPGKMMAQAAHCACDFEQWLRFYEKNKEYDLLKEVQNWREDRTFGTKIVLEATEQEILNLERNTGFSGLVYDPTYPWKNHYGELFLSNELVGCWVFINNLSISYDRDYIKSFPLHR